MYISVFTQVSLINTITNGKKPYSMHTNTFNMVYARGEMRSIVVWYQPIKTRF